MTTQGVRRFIKWFRGIGMKEYSVCPVCGTTSWPFTIQQLDEATMNATGNRKDKPKTYCHCNEALGGNLEVVKKMRPKDARRQSPW